MHIRLGNALVVGLAIWWPAAVTVQADVSNVTKQSAPVISPQAEVKPPSGKLPTAVSDADIEKEDALWKETPEYVAFKEKLQPIINAAETHPYFTSNEVAVLITYMQNPHPRARGEAVALAMGSSDPDKPIVLPYVLSLLSDPVWRVRRAAANTLGEIGDNSMIPYLEPLLNDRPEVAKVAQRVISTLQQKETVPKDH